VRDLRAQRVARRALACAPQEAGATATVAVAGGAILQQGGCLTWIDRIEQLLLWLRQARLLSAGLEAGILPVPAGAPRRFARAAQDASSAARQAHSASSA